MLMAPARSPDPWFVTLGLALLRWLDSPSRVISAALLLLVATLCAVIYQERVVLIAWQSSLQPVEQEEIDRRRAMQSLIDVMRETGGVAASVSDWDVARNRRIHVVAVSREGREMEVTDRVLPIVRNPALPSIILPALLAGEVPCVDPIPPAPSANANAVDRLPSDIRQLSLASGAVAYCVAAISTNTGVLTGAMTVLFVRSPDPRVVGAIMRRHASRIIAHAPERR